MPRENDDAAAAADAAFAAMVAANPGATVLDGPSRTAVPSDADADAAFARMRAAFPNAVEYDGSAGSASTHTESADEAYERIRAANPDATIIRGPAGGGSFPAPEPGAASTWRFSSDLSPERLQEIQALVGAAPPTSEDDAAQRAAADAAFEQLVAAQPGAREVAPGVFSADELPTGELGDQSHEKP
jgi:hypothetical protein